MIWYSVDREPTVLGDRQFHDNAIIRGSGSHVVDGPLCTVK